MNYEQERRIRIERDRQIIIENLKNHGNTKTDSGESVDDLSLMSLSTLESALQLDRN